VIVGNVMDAFTIVLDNGDEFSLIAKDETMAMQLAMELNAGQSIANAYQLMENLYV
jgi:hypothetical protein